MKHAPNPEEATHQNDPTEDPTPANWGGGYVYHEMSSVHSNYQKEEIKVKELISKRKEKNMRIEQIEILDWDR